MATATTVLDKPIPRNLDKSKFDVYPAHKQISGAYYMYTIQKYGSGIIASGLNIIIKK